MSKEQYNLSKQTNYLKRTMFLDPEGPVTVQRFEEVKYPRLAKYEETARGFFWVPEEISLTKDKIAHKDSSDAIKHIFTSNLLRQTALDSIQGRAPSQVFSPVISIPELEALVSNWSFFETNIHSKSYSHIIRNVYGVPKEEFNKIHDTKEIVEMSSSVGKYYDELHRINCHKELSSEMTGMVREEEHIKAIWLALNASYALEALRFMVSFASASFNPNNGRSILMTKSFLFIPSFLLTTFSTNLHTYKINSVLFLYDTLGGREAILSLTTTFKSAMRWSFTNEFFKLIKSTSATLFKRSTDFSIII